MAFPSHARVVIIGGGIMGCSTAYHLAKNGWKDVVLLEQGRLSGGTTWHAAGLVGQLRGTVTLTKMMMYGSDLYRRLRDETAAVVVLNLIPDLAVTPRFSRSDGRDAVGRQTIAFNEVIERLGRAHAVELVDLYTTSRLEVPLRPELMWSDGYHPSDLGYARWAELEALRSA